MIYKVHSASTNLKVAEEINRTIALGMIRKYRQNQYLTLINNGYPAQTRSIYFTINELQSFLEKMEDMGSNGCRIYLAAVTQEAVDTYATGQDELVGAMTVLMVATKTNVNNKHEEQINDNDYISMPAFDFGTLCPPSGCQAILMSPGNSLDFDAN